MKWLCVQGMLPVQFLPVGYSASVVAFSAFSLVCIFTHVSAASGKHSASKRDPTHGAMSFKDGTDPRLLEAVHRACLDRGGASTAHDPHDIVDRADCVVAAADKFCWEEQWMMLVGDVKGAAVDQALLERLAATRIDNGVTAGFSAVEFGTYVGYSAVRLARLLPEGAKLYSVDPVYQDTARALVALAGLSERVVFLHSTAAEATKVFHQQGVKLDFVFIDHEKQDYLPSLQRIEAANLLQDKAVVVADNVDVFHINDYLEHVRKPGLYVSRHVHASLEYTESDEHGIPVIADGLEVSIYSPGMQHRTDRQRSDL